jgi:hypothetical protein
MGCEFSSVRRYIRSDRSSSPGLVVGPEALQLRVESGVAAKEQLVSCVFGPRVGDRHLGIPLGGELCLHPSTWDRVAPVVGRELVLASVGGQFVGGGLSGVGGAAQEVGQQLELVVAVAGADSVHRGVHPRVEAEQLRAPVAADPDDDGAAV